MPDLLDQLRDQRTAARTAADQILERAATEQRDLTAEEVEQHRAQVLAEREANDAIEAEHARQLAEALAAPTRRPGPGAPSEPVLTREASLFDWCQQRGMFDPADHELSLGRYIRGLATGRWEGAEHERALSEGTLTAGGHLVPTPLSARVIDLARNQARVFQAGAVTVPMTSQTLKLARLTGEGSPSWKAENAALTAQDLTFDSITFTARTMVRLITMSLELFEDSDPSADDIIANSFARQVALELDRAALYGTGTAPEIRGILNQTGVSIIDHGANGTSLATNNNYDWFIDAVFTVRSNNFEPNAQIVAPRTEQTVSKFKEATTNAYLDPPAALSGIPRLTTKQVSIAATQGTSSNASHIFTGQWNQAMVGVRTDFRLIPLRERFLADNLQVGWLAYMRADLQLAQPAAFAVDRGVLP